METTEMVMSQQDLLRFESLGDNCEFGLVLRALGSENSGMFRWALTNVAATTAAIASGFDGLYDRKNIVPNSKIMVRDLASGIAYHTELKSEETKGGLQFLKSGHEWDAAYEKEFEKFRYLKSKFSTRLSDPATIFVIKSNRGIQPADVSKLYRVLAEKAERKVRLLHVQMRRRGNSNTFQKVSPNIAVGYIDRFAPYMNADDSLKDQWHILMREALVNFEV